VEDKDRNRGRTAAGASPVAATAKMLVEAVT
jgi:hypothetical protein